MDERPAINGEDIQACLDAVQGIIELRRLVLSATPMTLEEGASNARSPRSCALRDALRDTLDPAIVAARA
jgi:hypothetical protein